MCVLYTVCLGVPLVSINGNGCFEQLDAFPEIFVREVSATLLECLVRAIIESPPLIERISYALVYTRNMKLRGNIFASILLLIPNCPELKRYINFIQYFISLFDFY